MKVISLLLAIFICFFLTIQTALGANKKNSGNGWVSSGGDHIPSNHAWFSGNKRISYCIILNPRYSKSSTEIKEYISKSSQIWKNYFNQKVFKNYPNKEHLPQFDFEFVECDSSTEVRFYFDVKDEDVDQAMKKYNDPMAFSVLKEYDYKTNRGKGFLWFSDLFKADKDLNQESLNSIILHELGHIYGIGHVKDTIMDENIAYTIKTSGSMAGYPTNFPYMNNLLLSIDQQRPLYFNYYEHFNYTGHVPFDLLNPETIYKKQVEIISGIFNRPINGAVKANFINQSNWANFQLILSDFSGSASINIKIASDGTKQKGPEIFRVLGLDSEGKEFDHSVHSEYYEIFGSITLQNGKTYSLILTLNMGEFHPVKIRAFIEGQTYLLFAQGPPGSYYTR